MCDYHEPPKPLDKEPDPKEQQVTLKDQLQRDLKINRYNLGHLAEIADVHRSQISQYLNGKITPSKRVASDLARAATELTGVNYRSSHFTHNSTLED